MSLVDKNILVTGGAGFLGQHIVKKLCDRGVPEKNIFVPRSKELDLRTEGACKKVTKGKDIVIHLAAKVGGIGFNQENPGELFYDNIMMGTRLIDAAYRAGVQKMVILGTVCSYPKFTPVPFKEDNLWNGYPEETNAPYGLAKKALLIQSQAYREEYGFNSIYLVPVNLYGPGDNFDPRKSHVIPALIKKVYDAKKAGLPYVEAWGTGRPTREFLYVEDAAEGIMLALLNYDKPEPVNLGCGKEISIQNLLGMICSYMDYSGGIHWQKEFPDGQQRRMLDITRAEKEFGFKASTDFETGLKKTIAWYAAQAM